MQILSKLKGQETMTTIAGFTFALCFFCVRILFFGYFLLRALGVLWRHPRWAVLGEDFTAAEAEQTKAEGLLPRPVAAYCAMQLFYVVRPRVARAIALSLSFSLSHW